MGAMMYPIIMMFVGVLIVGILFVVGVMNLYWISILTLFVLVEKTAPHHRLWVNSAALVLVAWGSWVLARIFHTPV